ncbi:MAG: PilZ domain-containing protein [Desulfopila sp.]
MNGYTPQEKSCQRCQCRTGGCYLLRATTTGGTMTDKRRYIRHDAIHLLDYLILDENTTDSGTYSMGRTLDTSSNGLKLETNRELPQGAHLRITLGLANDLVDLDGTVVYCHLQGGRFVSGIAFEKLIHENRRVFDLYLNTFNHRRVTN